MNPSKNYGDDGALGDDPGPKNDPPVRRPSDDGVGVGGGSAEAPPGEDLECDDCRSSDGESAESAESAETNVSGGGGGGEDAAEEEDTATEESSRASGRGEDVEMEVEGEEDPDPPTAVGGRRGTSEDDVESESNNDSGEEGEDPDDANGKDEAAAAAKAGDEERDDPEEAAKEEETATAASEKSSSVAAAADAEVSKVAEELSKDRDKVEADGVEDDAEGSEKGKDEVGDEEEDKGKAGDEEEEEEGEKEEGERSDDPADGSSAAAAAKVGISGTKAEAKLVRAPRKRAAPPVFWTSEEDEALRAAIAKHGDSRWALVAECLPRRNQYQARNRWNFTLKPGVIKHRKWTTNEDDRLRYFVRRHGIRNWAEIEREFPGRTTKQCRDRWHGVLDPKVRRGGWTEREDEIILAGSAKFGPGRWKEVARYLKGRNNDAVRCRWHGKLSKVAAERKERGEEPSKVDLDKIATQDDKEGRAKAKDGGGMRKKDRLVGEEEGKDKKWSPDEDDRLDFLVRRHGPQWTEIESKIRGRTAKQCRDRWRNALDPAVKRGGWTGKEDEIVLKAVAELGPGRWTEVAQLLKGRTNDDVRARWHARLWRIEQERADGTMSSAEEESDDEEFAAAEEEEEEGTTSATAPSPKDRKKRPAEGVEASTGRSPAAGAAAAAPPYPMYPFGFFPPPPHAWGMGRGVPPPFPMSPGMPRPNPPPPQGFVGSPNGGAPPPGFGFPFPMQPWWGGPPGAAKWPPHPAMPYAWPYGMPGQFPPPPQGQGKGPLDKEVAMKILMTDDDGDKNEHRTSSDAKLVPGRPYDPAEDTPKPLPKSLKELPKLNLSDLPPHIEPLPHRNALAYPHKNTHYRGATLKKNGKYESRIMFKGEDQFFGQFNTEWEAAAVYAWAFELLHGRGKAREQRERGRKAAEEAGVKLPQRPAGSKEKTARDKASWRKAEAELDRRLADATRAAAPVVVGSRKRRRRGGGAAEPREPEQHVPPSSLSDLPDLSLSSLPSYAEPLPLTKASQYHAGNNNERHFRGAVYRPPGKSGSKTERWETRITYNSQKKWLGQYGTEWEAGAVYAWAYEMLHGRERTRSERAKGRAAAREAGAMLPSRPEHLEAEEDSDYDYDASGGGSGGGGSPSKKRGSSKHRRKEKSAAKGRRWSLSAIRFANLPGHIRPLPIYDYGGSHRKDGGEVYRGAYQVRNKKKWGDKIKWMARIKVEGTEHNLGLFDNDYQAGAMFAWAYTMLNGTEKARVELHKGETACSKKGIPLPWKPAVLPPHLHRRQDEAPAGTEESVPPSTESKERPKATAARAEAESTPPSDSNDQPGVTTDQAETESTTHSDSKEQPGATTAPANSGQAQGSGDHSEPSPSTDVRTNGAEEVGEEHATNESEVKADGEDEDSLDELPPAEVDAI